MSKPLSMRNNGSGNSKAPPPPPPQNTAAKEAATRGRALASNYRKSANSVDAIRAKVKAEMKAEQAAAKERALAIVAEKEQAENERSAEAEQRLHVVGGLLQRVLELLVLGAERAVQLRERLHRQRVLLVRRNAVKHQCGVHCC